MVRRIYITRVLGIGMLVCALCGAPVLAQSLRPPELNVQYHRAETAWKSGASVLEAKARIDRVLQALPDDVQALKLRTQVLMALDRTDEAHRDALHAVDLAPGDGEAHLLLAETARLLGDEKQARRALDAAAERVLDDAGFHIRLSWNASLLGQLDKAEAFARIALALDAREPSGYYQLARVFVRQKRLDEAAAILARGLRGAVVDPGFIRQDTVLVHVAAHPDLSGLMGK